jgi:hypothetical protein
LNYKYNQFVGPFARGGRTRWREVKAACGLARCGARRWLEVKAAYSSISVTPPEMANFMASVELMSVKTLTRSRFTK